MVGLVGNLPEYDRSHWFSNGFFFMWGNGWIGMR